MPISKRHSVHTLIKGLNLVWMVWPGVAPCLAEEPGCAVIRYATNLNYAPFDWDDGGDGYAGAAVSLLNIVVPAGVGLSPVKVPWVRAQKMAAEGEIDLLVAIRPTTERRKLLEFTDARAFKNPITVFTRRAADFEYRGWNDLVGRTGGIARGDSFGEEFDNYLKAKLNVEEAPSITTNLKKLEMGRVDYVLASYYAALTEIKGTEYEGRIVAHKVPVTEGDIGFAFSKKSPCRRLVGEVSAKLKSAEVGGVPERLVDEAIEQYAKRRRQGEGK